MDSVTWCRQAVAGLAVGLTGSMACTLAHAATAGTFSGPGWVAHAADPKGDVVNDPAKFSGKGWYVDANAGADDGPGTQARPWKSLARAAAASLGSGDALLLRCGSTWREALVLPRVSNLLVAAYGDCAQGERPIIRGSMAMAPAGWKKAEGLPGGYAIDWARPVSQVHFNGAALTPARYPHARGLGKEFALADGMGQRDKLRLRPQDLKALKVRDLVGATIHVRATPWQIESAKVASFDEEGGVITLDKPVSAPMVPRTGYILEGKRWMLASPGEWFHDAAAGQLLVVPPAGGSPASSLVEATTLERGIVATGLQGLRIERVSLEQFGLIAAEIRNAEGVALRGVRVVDATEYGIYIDGSARASVKQSEVGGVGWTGISVRNSAKAVVQGNRVQDTGLRGRAGGSRAAITVEGPDALVSGNLVERSANLGINFFNRPGTRVLDNTVLSSCLRLTDCGGIYTWTATDAKLAANDFKATATVEGNIVLGGGGNLDGTPDRGENQVCGIYLDEMSSGISVSKNIVMGPELGLCLHNAQFNVVTGNTVGAVKHASFSATQSRRDTDLVKGNRVSGNRLVARDNEVTALQWNYPRADWRQVLKKLQPDGADENHIVSLTGEGAFYRPYTMGGSSASIIPQGPFVPYFNPAGSGGAMLPSKAVPCPKGPCFGFVAGHGDDLVSTPSFVLENEPGKDRYVLSYTATGGQGGGLSRAVVRRAGPPYDILGLNQTATPLKPGQSLRTELVFQATGSGTARVDFSGQTKGETLFSDVSLKRVRDFKPANLSRLAVQLVNLSATPRAFNCADLGWDHCEATDESGQPVTWPLKLAGRSTALVLARDPAWRRR